MRIRLLMLAVVAALAATALVAGGASTAAASQCTSKGYYIVKRQHVKCKNAKKVFNKLYNSGFDPGFKLGNGWKCGVKGDNYNGYHGNCKKRNSDKQVVAQFHYQYTP